MLDLYFSSYILRIVIVESRIFIASGWLLKFDGKTGDIELSCDHRFSH